MKSAGPVILVHGGAGLRAMTAPQAACLQAALEIGYHLLNRGVSSLAAVEQVIRVLEQSGLFNAGKGARRQLDGVRRMDASIMEGLSLRAGAVASIEGIVHPIAAARLVMEETHHVLLVGPMATAFARYFELESQRTGAPNRRLSYGAMLERKQLLRDRHGTVGAVALDRSGTIAAGASTGGIDRMLPGRVGDTPIIGCGVYADNQSGAVSMTGIGEGIMRIAAAKEICDRLALRQSPVAAAKAVLKKLVTKIAGAGGALVLAPNGRFAIRHVTPRMAAGWWDGKGKPTVGDRFQ